MLSELMLYTPLNGAVDESRIYELFTETAPGEQDGRTKVSIVKNQVMPFLEGVEQAVG